MNSGIASGYGSVWVLLLLGGDDACTHLVIRFCFRYSLNSHNGKALAKARRLFTIIDSMLSNFFVPKLVFGFGIALQTSLPAMVGVPDDTSKH